MLKTILGRVKYLVSPKRKFRGTLRRYLGFYPNELKYYELAFLHRSASLIDNKGLVINNERLEYLGDSVLDAVIADFLYYRFPSGDEGFLTQMRSKIVNGTNLSELARLLRINKLVVTNISQSVSKKHIYEDAFEAFIGAMYLDYGYMFVKKYVINHLLVKYIDVDKLLTINSNYKSQLIEWGQKYKKEVEFYTDLESYNSKYFVCYVRIEGENVSSGTGLSKKEAEQKASKVALEKIESNPPIENN